MIRPEYIKIVEKIINYYRNATKCNNFVTIFDKFFELHKIFLRKDT